MKDVRAIIFDLDGTLFDLTPLVHAARGRVAGYLYGNGFFSSRDYALRRINDLERRHGPYYSSSPFYFAFYDIAKGLLKDKPDAFRRYLKTRTKGKKSEADPVESLVEDLEQIYNVEDVEDLRPFADAFETLKALRNDGILLFLVTLGRPARQRNKIDRLGLAPHFDKIVNEGPRSHDYWFRELLKEHDLSTGEVACVGDRAQDEIRTGNRMGLTTVWLKKGRFAEEEPAEGDRPDYQIRYLAQLPTLLKLARLGKDRDNLKVVAIGGGTGLPTVLTGMQTYTNSPSAVVAVTDTGASTGRIRWNLGVQPPGDVRNALIALADPRHVPPGLHSVFQHRFPDTEQEAGIFKNDHIGNFLVAALTQQSGDFQEAIRTASEMLHVKGSIFPASTDNVHLCAELENGEHRYTEWMVRKPGKSPLKRAYLVSNDDILREVERKNGALRRVEDRSGQVEIHEKKGKRFRTPKNRARASKEAARAIAEADIVVLGPGSLFTSVITNLLVPDIQNALLDRTDGLTVYVCNIMTQPGQTDGFAASDHLRLLLRHLPDARGNQILDHVLLQDETFFQTPSGKVWKRLLDRYRKDKKELVECDSNQLDGLAHWTQADLTEDYQTEAMNRGVGDFISHSPEKVADAICRIYCGLDLPGALGES